MTRFIRPAAVVIVLLSALALSYASASAQTAVLVTELRCESDPEIVVIRNEGASDVDLRGWRLESDPVGEQQFDLSQVGTLPASASVTIASGPSAQAIFVWSQDFIFRDGDPGDFVRLIDAGGSVIQEGTCARQPSPGPHASPGAPSPDGSVDLPNGGGPPLAPEGGSGLTLLLTGGLLLSAGLTLTAISLLLGAAFARNTARSPELPRFAQLAATDTREPGSSATTPPVHQRLVPYLLLGLLALFVVHRFRAR